MIKTLFLSMLTILSNSCQNEKSISVGEAFKEIDSKNVIFLDAREAHEYKVSKIKGAKLVGYKKFKIDDHDFSDDKIYIVYCSVGQRSADISNRLKELGHEAYNLKGGIFEWSNSLLPLVNSKGELTKKVHGYNLKWSKMINHGEVVLGE